MVHERYHAPRSPARSEERDLVEVFYEYVKPRRSEAGVVVAAGNNGKGVSRADTMDADSVECYSTLASVPSAAEKSDFVTAVSEAAENLMQVELGTTAMRILAIVPVNEEKPH